MSLYLYCSTLHTRQHFALDKLLDDIAQIIGIDMVDSIIFIVVIFVIFCIFFVVVNET